MCDEFWEKRLKKLEEEVRKSVLDLFGHTGSQVFKISLDPPKKTLFVIAGDLEAINSLI